MKVSRADFMCRVLGMMNIPYVWGGRERPGVDCSGVPILALYELSLGAIDLRKWWSDRLWRELPETIDPDYGDLAFYGGNTPDDVDHVMVIACPPGNASLPDGLVVGACDGGSWCTSPSVALSANPPAKVKVRDSVAYRKHFRGYRSMRLFFFD